jgi:NAD(P)-dependent dehydrogenase (short-subunit alcohol dehydrogenase family)
MAYPLDILEAVYRANVIAPLAVLQAVADQLKPGVRLINITSDAGAEAY